MDSERFTTAGGIRGTRHTGTVDHRTALDGVWAQIDRQVGRWQAALEADGLKAGERVAVMLRNCPEWVAYDQAALGLGLVVALDAWQVLGILPARRSDLAAEPNPRALQRRRGLRAAAGKLAIAELADVLYRHLIGALTINAGADADSWRTLLLLLGCLLYVPTAAVWGLCFCVGPGFAVGTGTSVGIAGSTLGAVPALPLLAALPAGSGSPAWWLALAVPVGAGVAAGCVADRTVGSPPGDEPLSWRTLLRSTALTAGLVGALVAAAVAGLAWLSAGPAGPGRMATTGPDWWAVGPAAGLEVAAAAAVTLAALAALRRHRQPGTDA